MRIVKRATGRHQFQNVNVRIGNADETGSTSVEFSQNPIVGTFGLKTNDLEHIFDINPRANGRYMTLQNHISDVLSIDEVYVSTV